MRSPFIFALCSIFALTVAPAFAVSRTVAIAAPASVVAGAKVAVSVKVSTDAGGGEQIGFIHAQYSSDDGKTWINFCFEDKVGSSAVRATSFSAGPAGSRAIVRIRIAFRGGKAGDVDFTGVPIQWDTSWGKWLTPPAKIATISVVAR